MNQKLRFTIPGVPRGKDRPRSTGRVVQQDGQARALVTVHSDPGMVRAEREILLLYRQAFPGREPWTGPVMLRFTAVFPIPSSWTKAQRAAALTAQVYHTSKPDKDNIEKLLVDALTPPQRKPGALVAPSPAGFPWMDDGQVQGGGVKRYGECPRTEVELEFIAQPDLPLMPAEKRAKARLAAGDRPAPARPRQSKPTKSKRPARLQAAIDRAVAKEEGR